MDLLAISYQNIWPFRSTKTIFFDKWKFLIKAPIWSWKSFLFFDGPIYALYKYSSRNILNINSKDWYIKVLIDINWEQYFIVRELKRSKVKESCSSKLFRIANLDKESLYENQKETISDKDIEKTLKDLWNIDFEEISFKNESDIQQNLNDLLPPREVFLNTVFLMQDSDNIFELAPAERLTVLKNVFNLLWIDEAKEIVADKKRELNYKIKALWDTSKYDEKFSFLLNSYFNHIEKIKESDFFKETFDKYTKDFEELFMIKDKLQINELDSEIINDKFNNEVIEYLEIKKNLYQKLSHEKEITSQQLDKSKSDLSSLDKNSSEKQAEINQIEIKIKKLNESDSQDIKNKKKSLQEEIKDKEKIIPKDKINTFLNLNILETEVKEINLQSWYFIIQELKNLGKLLSENKSTKELEIKNMTLKQENEIEKINYEIEKTKKNKEIWEKDINEVLERLNNSKKNKETQEIFECEKIKTNCPFIKVINKKTFDELDRQFNILENEYSQKKKHFESENFDEKINNLEQTKKQLSENNQNIVELNTEITKIVEKINIIKTFLQEIWYKLIEDSYSSNQSLSNQINKLDEEINRLEEEQSKLQQYKLDLENHSSKLESIKEQKERIEKDITDKQLQIKQLEIDIQNINIDKIRTLENSNNECINTIKNIKTLIIEYKTTQIEIKKMKEEEILLNDLYQIISKEILLLALRDNLPILTDIINTFLAQVVDYQISLNLNEDNPDKLELEAKITDEKGTRDTKSLSWWQRVILKLVRMLAICSYMHTNILFLDETINNLDADTIGKVADMISDFVKQKDIKLYIITHSQHIQNMDIRDKIVEIETLD